MGRGQNAPLGEGRHMYIGTALFLTEVFMRKFLLGKTRE